MNVLFLLILTFGWHCQDTQSCDGTPKFKPIVLVHGGAGEINPSKATKLLRGVKLAARIGYKKLDERGSAMDAVEAAIRSMEVDDDFNAGYGSVLTIDGTVENDASIMDGRELEAGCVSLITDILHPISVARRVLEKLPHSYMAGLGAMKFAREQGFEVLSNGSLASASSIADLKYFKSKMNSSEIIGSDKIRGGTIGAVAIDACGNVAAGTSTGGLTGKLSGRIGDSPLIGSGTYADNELGAISVTGAGESIMKYNVAQRIMQNINFRSTSGQDASEEVLNEMAVRLKATAGCILVDKFGDVGIYFTTKGMPWAYQKRNDIHFGIFKNENFYERLIKLGST